MTPLKLAPAHLEVAAIKPQGGFAPVRFGELRMQRRRRAIACQGLVITSELAKRIAPVEECDGIIGVQRDGAIQAVEGFVMASQVRKDDAAIAVGFDICRIDYDGPVEARQRFMEALLGSWRTTPWPLKASRKSCCRAMA